MAETPLTPLDPFADSPQESTPYMSAEADAETMARVFAPSPPTPFAIQVHSQYHGQLGYLYTTGLHAQGFPEIVAQGVPRHRAPLVVKNMYFLAGRMFQGISVQPGHRSTDHDYRVVIVAGPSHTLTLLPFYPDCEEWGSFPPAPCQERVRRNRLLAAAWFSTGDTFDATDAAYFVHHVEHFARLLQVGDLPRMIATLPRDLQGLIHEHISVMPPIPRPNGAVTFPGGKRRAVLVKVHSNASKNQTLEKQESQLKPPPPPIPTSPGNKENALAKTCNNDTPPISPPQTPEANSTPTASNKCSESL